MPRASSESSRVTLRPALLAALAALAARVLSGCLGDDEAAERRSRSAAHVLTLYASRPTEGPSAATAPGGRRGAAPGARGRGRRARAATASGWSPCRRRSRATGNWDPGQVSENAERAANDPRAIAYLGELNLGASAVSVPVTNNAGLLQVSPADGLASLTEAPPRSAARARALLPVRARAPSCGSCPTTWCRRADRRPHGGARRGAPGADRGHRRLRARAGRRGRRRGAPGGHPARRHQGPARRPRHGPRRRRRAGRGRGAPDAVVLALARDRYTPQLLSGLRRALPQARAAHGRRRARRGSRCWRRRAPSRRRSRRSPRRPRAGPAPRGAACSTGSRRDQGAELASRPPSGATSRCASRSTRSGPRSAAAGAPSAGVIHAALSPRARRSPIGTYEVRRNGAVEGLPMALYRLRGDRFEYVRTLF